jgi:hypothetical protein
VSLAFAASTLAMDKAYEIANITKDPLSRDKDTSLRTLVYMVRCAYAHGIADPRWQVRNDYKQFHPPKSLVGASGLDFSTLDGKSFDFDQIGGYQNWFFIRDEAIDTLRTKANIKP